MIEIQESASNFCAFLSFVAYPENRCAGLTDLTPSKIYFQQNAQVLSKLACVAKRYCQMKRVARLTFYSCFLFLFSANIKRDF